jgi:hypothetical protein
MPHQRKENKCKKEFLRTVIVGDFYAFNLCKVVDAAHQVYYIGERTNRGGTVIGDTEQDVIRQLEAQVPIINDFLAKTR